MVSKCLGARVFLFNTAAGDDPPVNRFLEFDDKPTKIANSFSASLEMAVQDDLEEMSGIRKTGEPYRLAL